MNDVKDFGEYAVKNVKNFMGMDTYGFNCTLYRGKNKVAFCIDDGNGGEVCIDWANPPKVGATDKEWDEWRAWRKSEEDLLDKHLNALPKVKSQYGGADLTIDAGWFVTELVNKFEREREIRKVQRQCKDKTLYRTAAQKDGSYYIIKAPFDQRVKDHIIKKNGQDVEIFNEVFEQGGIPSVLA